MLAAHEASKQDQPVIFISIFLVDREAPKNAICPHVFEVDF